MKKVLTSICLTSAIAFVGMGCSEADRTIDCAQICEKWENCFEEDVDNSDCVDTCEDAADADEDFERKVDNCEGCLDNTSCSEATVECTDECAVIIAKST